jgi:hypothetical protein
MYNILDNRSKTLDLRLEINQFTSKIQDPRSKINSLKGVK